MLNLQVVVKRHAVDRKPGAALAGLESIHSKLKSFHSLHIHRVADIDPSGVTHSEAIPHEDRRQRMGFSSIEKLVD